MRFNRNNRKISNKVEPMNQKIKQHFSKFKQITNKSVNKYLNENNDIKQYCQKLLIKNENYLNLFYLIKYFIIEKVELSFCKTCGKQLNIDQTLRHKIYCSTLCANTNKDFIIKRQNTNIQKFNSITPLANNSVRQQIQQTNIKKYGCKASWNNPQIRRKIIENTDFQKRNKRSEQTCLAKYGVRKKQFLTIWNTIKQWKDYIIPLFQLSEYDGKSKIYKWKCVNAEISLNQILDQHGIYIRYQVKYIDIFQDARFVFQNQKHQVYLILKNNLLIFVKSFIQIFYRIIEN